MEIRRLYHAELAEGLPGEHVELDERARKHAYKVLRLSPGARVLLFDGEGHEAPAILGERGSCRVEEVRVHTLPGPVVHLLLAVPKGPAADDAVRMATELGVASVHFVHTRRAVPKEATDAKLARWERIALEAVRQCERPTTPRIVAPVELREALALPKEDDERFFAWARSDEPVLREGSAAARWVAVGPEGGFTDEEVASLRAAGFVEISLAATILRVSTAVAAALTLLRR